VAGGIAASRALASYKRFRSACCADEIATRKGLSEVVKEFAFINLFRALAAFWVLAAHCMIWGGWYGLPLPSAKIAVDLFMMISGYLMVANAVARKNREPLTSPRNWLRFWTRRYFRIAPAYYVSLAVAVITAAYFLGGYEHLQSLNPTKWPPGGVYNPAHINYTAQNIFMHISFLFGLQPTYSFSTFLPDWSLSLEMQFYFAFPLLFFLMERFGYAVVAVILGVLAFLLRIKLSHYLIYPEPSVLVMKLNYFLAGALIFRFLQTKSTSKARITLASAAIFLVSIDYQYGRELLMLPIIFAAMLGFGWMELHGRTPRAIQWIVNNSVTHFTSDVSYGVYLFHGFFISACGLIIAARPELLKFSPPARVGLVFLFVMTSTYLVAYAAHRMVELPGIELGKRVIKRWLPAKAEVRQATIIQTAPQSDRTVGYCGSGQITEPSEAIVARTERLVE
jgi:peptidoglycan/LPS O-acetylase OafA/YrhL